ncbi:dihydrodipicolinate synthase family protein [Cyclobacterium qasimii]|uniref:Dihydrodipicolinate synthase family protein n=2 Tax=Cyclobacterium qasimii TaxID=1350429 RepID=A0A512C8Z5_9BACT|nr:dihydrodipicolinate synthase family protein [Cyclobacterium qasimii]EPR68554.1 putative dihydrodipicolinate synthase [Cyclobacterium qasimii M12-11B]GEO20650.1 dihydrodipicolinate synthase family protein [Cyclobacterium qasimii]
MESNDKPLVEKELYPLKGIVTVLNTPFTREDTIDYSALKNNVLEALKAGVAGFLVPAMAAEVYKLSYTERQKMLALVLETVENRVPVIGGAGEQDLSKSKALLKTYLNLGCKNVLFQIPFVDELQFRNHFMELAALDPEMIMLQDWNASGYGLSDDLICNLFEEVPNFRCLKIETVPAGPKYSRILELTKGKLNVSGGWAVSQMIEGLHRGVHAFMPTGMHSIYTSIYHLFEEGKYEDAEALFEKIIPVLAFSNQHLDISIHFFKRLLYRQGIYPTPNVRNPILPFDALHQKLADKHIDRILQIENELKTLSSNLS